MLRSIYVALLRCLRYMISLCYNGHEFTFIKWIRGLYVVWICFYWFMRMSWFQWMGGVGPYLFIDFIKYKNFMKYVWYRMGKTVGAFDSSASWVDVSRCEIESSCTICTVLKYGSFRKRCTWWVFCLCFTVIIDRLLWVSLLSIVA